MNSRHNGDLMTKWHLSIPVCTVKFDLKFTILVNFQTLGHVIRTTVIMIIIFHTFQNGNRQYYHNVLQHTAVTAL